MAKKKGSNSFVWLIVIVVIIIGIVIGVSLKSNTHTFNCDDDKTIKAKFNSGNDTSVDLTLNNGQTMNLAVTPSAGGARYANADESVVFWNTGNTATLDENDKTTYANCVEK